jgi:cysteinyl-tRNA synthetase
MSSLHLYDTLTRTTSAFTPIKEGQVGIYLCGATVQAPPHIGHVRSGVNFDILRRWLTKSGYDVTFIRNVTDIDDKILHKAVHEESPWWAVAMKYERAFTQAYEALNVLPPTYEPRATGHITQMIELMQILIERGAAYAPGNGDVYLEVRKLSSYLTLSRQKVDDLLSAADADETFKKDPRDFALWKAAKAGDPSWPTPWGAGRPGWHLECSAMAYAYLGESFDIHGGGLDLIFPHHEMSATQANLITGKEFARHYVHSGMVGFEGEKMSKSKGNLVFVSKLIASGVDPMVIRLALLMHHYRDDHMWSNEELGTASEFLDDLRTALSRTEVAPTDTVIAEIIAALANNLDTPRAITVLSEWVTQSLSGSEDCVSGGSAGELSRAIDALLGIAL